MGLPLRQAAKIGAYVMKKHLSGGKYPLVLMLEPLFRCNLECAGCGKIDYPDPILNQRLSVAKCLEAVDECGAPIVVLAGGEPLLHREIEEIVEGIIARKKFVYLCTNALLLEKKIDLFKPNPYFAWTVHLDGDKEDHDHSVCQDGVYDRAVEAIRHAKSLGFRVNINATLFNTADPERMANFFDAVTDMGIHGITVSPGYAYERAPDQEHFPQPAAHQGAVPRHLPPRPQAALVVQPIEPLPRFSRRQPELSLHAVGQSVPQLFRLAAALLPARRRLCQDL
jgi:hopanoid biosynthesis associated radical SAM protein HpnH